MAQLADYSLSHRITPEGATMKTLGPNPEAAVLPCRGFQALLCGLLLAAGTGCRESVPQGTGGDGAELKWARKVAESFLKALTVDNGKTAYGLLGTDYRERLPEDQRTGKYWVRPDPFGSVLSWEIDGEELAPDRSEVVFQGRIRVRYLTAGEREHPFFVMVAKEKDSGSWRVSNFLMERLK